jgi:hypothetical protein
MKIGLFISIPKCGTNTIREMFDLGPNRDNDKSYLDIPIIYENHQRLKILEKKYNLNNIYIFTFVRHPYDRIKSWYYYHKNQFPEYNMPLNEWVNNGCKTHWTIQNGTNWKDLKLSPLLQYNFIEGNNKINYIGKIDNFEEDCINIINDINKIYEINNINKVIKYNKLKLNKSENKKDELTPESKNIIYNLFKKDFDYFNFDLMDIRRN